MKIQKLHLKGFKRFHDLTIDLGNNPKKIIALVGPNGCGKSSVFDAFEKKAAQIRGSLRNINESYYSKAFFSPDIREPYRNYDDIQIITERTNEPITNKSFLIRSAYRFTTHLNVTELRQIPAILDDAVRPNTTIDIDNRLEENYKRIFSTMLKQIDNGKKNGDQIKEELLGKLNNILLEIMDIRISSFGNILEPNEGKFFFEKGTSKKFPYENLSSGEKEVIDIVIDLIIKGESFNDTIYCIDEPELHINTAIQRRLLMEISKIIPDNCQLWIATHSIGFLRALQEELKEAVQVINFSGCDFDTPIILTPMLLNRKNWKTIFETALEDLTGLVAPKILVYCEGKKEPDGNGHEEGLDATVYNNIFEDLHDVHFVSSGGSTEPDINSEFALLVLSKALSKIQIFLLKDKDINNKDQNTGIVSPTTEQQRQDWLKKGEHHRMLIRKEIENYLFDFEVIQKAFPKVIEEDYRTLIKNSIEDQDVKEKVAELMKLCKIDNSMNKKAFMIHLSKFFDKKMKVYTELKDCIFPTMEKSKS